MNNEKNAIAITGWLYFYTIFLIVNSVSPFIPIVSFFYAPPLILIPFYITSLVLIHRRSLYAINVNSVTLVATIILELSTIYTILQSKSEAPGFITGLVMLSNITVILISLGFLAYLNKSKKVKDFFTQTPIPRLNEQLDVTPISIAPAPTYNPVNASHFAVLFAISLLSCGVFIYTGWSLFLATPVAFIFSIVYSTYFTKVIKNNNVTAFSVYTVTFTLLFAYISIALNMGIFSDSEYINYLIPELLGVASGTFTKIFSTLFFVSLLYLLFSIPVNNSLIKKNARKGLFWLVPLIGLILIAVHVLVIWLQLPQLKVEAVQVKEEKQQKVEAEIESSYTFDWTKITKNTFEKRMYSIFTAPAPATGIPANACPYALGLLEQNLSEVGFNVNCLNDSLISIGKMPITDTTVVGANISNTSDFLKKGDVVVVVAELENPSMLRVHADGNAAKDCACRMPPFDYSGIVDYVKTGTSTGIYEQSVVQMQVIDKKRTVMLLYPINVNDLKDINIKLSQFSTNPNVPVTLKEFAVISPDKLPADPEWLKKWLNEPNPFLK